MPLSRYQIRNEYSLADPELYKAANKDDPEALLEGVAMAGLVGVLRQLGDLAEFAAEVFHDLHEEVIATAARGHSLMVRVQQLEAEVPSIEKAFLSQTNHSSFFYNAGIDWHPNMHMDQNLITQGDMPRFIMDSYEECRGPPRLFLLDKFDVAGAGACLKRYTDPSFFKLEASSPEIINLDVQREKRTRRGKKKGSRWRNAETPEVLPAPHAKLHQLLLEERIENTVTDPARRVKLKRRLNGFPFDSRTGKSYMEKFLKVPSPEHELVHDISICSSPLKLPVGRTYESGLHIHDINLESPDKKFRHGSLSPARDMEGTEQKLPMDRFDELTFDSGIYDSPVENRSYKLDNVLSSFHKEVGEKEIAIDRETRSDGIIDGYQSDGVASEVDNYVDALATMESEMDTDSELRSKSDFHISNNKRQMSGFDATAAEHQAPFSDSQSRGSSMLSEDGNSYLKREMLSSSYSDIHSISTENTPLEGEISTESFLVNEICEEKGTARLLREESIRDDIVLAPSTGHANNGGTEVAEVPAYRFEHREQTISNVTILPPTLSQTDVASSLTEHVMVDREAVEMLRRHTGLKTESINNTGSQTNLNISVPSAYKMLDAPRQTENDSSPRASAEKQAIDELDDKYLNMDESLPGHLSNIPWYTRDAASLADSAENQHLEDLRSEENVSSLSSTYLHLDELVHNNSKMIEHPPERSCKDLSVNRLEGEDPNVISGGTDDLDSLSGATDDMVALCDATVDKPNTVNIDPEDEKSKNSMGNIPQRENAKDNYTEGHVCSQIYLPISVAPHAEELSPSSGLPELETHDTATESDHIVSASEHVILPAAEEDPIEHGLPELGIRHTARESNKIVSESDEGIPAAAVVAGGVSSVRDSPKFVCSEALHLARIKEDIELLDPTTNPIEDQMDSPIPVITHLEEKSLESSVMGSPKDVHSKDLNISGIINDIQPLDPAVNLTGNHADSMIQVMSQLDNSLDLAWSLDETLGKDEEPGDETEDVNNMIPPTGEIAADIQTTTENSNISDLKEQQASVITDSSLQLDSAEEGILHNAELNLHEHTSSKDGVRINGVAPCIDLVGSDTANFNISPDGISLTRNVNLSDADAKRDEADTVSLAGSNENAKDSGASKLDKESLSNFEESNQNQNEPEVSVQERYCGSDMQKELGQLKVSTPASGSDLSETLHHGHAEAELPSNTPDSPAPVEGSLAISNAATTSTLLGSGLGTFPSEMSNFTDYAEDTTLLPIHHVGEEKEVKLSFHQLDTGESKVLENAAKASLEPLPQLKQNGGLDQEGCSSSASVSSLVDILSQSSVSQLLPNDSCSIGGIFQPTDPSSGSIAFQLLCEAKFNLEEMPPLPPLPPVQWRMGKQQHASSVQEKQVTPRNLGAFPSFSHSTSDQKDETSEPILPRYKIVGENSHLVNEYTSRDQVYDGPFSLHLPPVVNHENNTNNLPPVGATRSMSQLFPLSEKFDEIPQDDSHVGEKEKAQPSFSKISQGISIDAASTYASKLQHDEASKLQHHVAKETSSKDEKLDQVARSDANIISHVEKSDDIRRDDSNVGEKEIVLPGLSTISQETRVDAASTYSSKIPLDEASQPEHHLAPERSSEDEKLDQVSAHSDANIITDVEKLDEIPRDDSHVGEKEKVQFDLSTIPQGTSKDASSTCASKMPHDEASQLQHHVAPETSQKGEKCDQVSVHSDGNITHDGDVLTPKIGNEQPQIVMSSPMGEIAWTAQDDGKANAGRTIKLPRPRNPLIDAVVAHDKSKLRKVTGNPRPPIQKADERDSLLEQIRAKSFNLKRTVVSRPSIQGPTTNLRVAAILEKAKTIRRAFAESDEDDDEDSWSDS